MEDHTLYHTVSKKLTKYIDLCDTEISDFAWLVQNIALYILSLRTYFQHDELINRHMTEFAHNVRKINNEQLPIMEDNMRNLRDCVVCLELAFYRRYLNWPSIE